MVEPRALSCASGSACPAAVTLTTPALQVGVTWPVAVSTETDDVVGLT